MYWDGRNAGERGGGGGHHHRGGVVVGDGSRSLPIADTGVGDIGNIDEESFVRFNAGVTVDQYIEGVTAGWLASAFAV